jgi:hypothetical protein
MALISLFLLFMFPPSDVRPFRLAVRKSDSFAVMPHGENHRAAFVSQYAPDFIVLPIKAF